MLFSEAKLIHIITAQLFQDKKGLETQKPHGFGNKLFYMWQYNETNYKGNRADGSAK